MPKQKIIFTFILSGHAKTVHQLSNNDSEDAPFISIAAATYESAVKKILKLKIPNIEDETSIVWQSIEEIDEEDTNEVKQTTE